MYRDFYKTYLEKAVHKNGEVSGLCPFHDDKNPSFSANVKTGQAQCFGCSWKGNAFTFAKARSIPYSEVPGYQKNDASKKGRIVKKYDYVDEKGCLLFQVVRYEPKKFRQRRPDGKGGWIWNLKSVRRVLYNLPAILQADEVVVVEGEKDADRLNELQFAATTSPGGAEKWRDEYNSFLRNKDVVLIPDNDSVGKSHVRKIANKLQGIARTIKVIDLPEVGPKGDVSDYLEMNPPEALRKLIQKTGTLIYVPQDINLLNLNKTDLGNAEAVVKLFGEHLRYNHTSKNWLIWCNHYWKFDKKGEINLYVQAAIRERFRQATEIENNDLRKSEIRWALDSESGYRIQTAIKLAAHLHPVATTINEYDQSVWLMGCENGILDLQSGKLREGKPEDMITLCSQITSNP